MTSKQYKERHKDYLTVGQLKKRLEDYPDDALVVAQRVEDMYYDVLNGWETLKKPNNVYPEFNNEYTAVWSPVSYGDDKECFYLDLHY
jgi:hypothetical protein